MTVRAFPLVLTDPDDAFGLPTWVAYWRDRGHGFDDADVRDWDAGMAAAREGGFVYALLYLVVAGTRPEGLSTPDPVTPESGAGRRGRRR